MTERTGPRIRITSDGNPWTTTVELITRHGAVVDLRSVVQAASWSITHDDRAKVTLHISAGSVELLGDLTEVTVTPSIDLWHDYAERVEQLDGELKRLAEYDRAAGIPTADTQ